MTRRHRGVLVALALAGATAAQAQGPGAVRPGNDPRPLIIRAMPDPGGRHRAMTPLAPEQLARFRQAQQLRQAKLFQKARDELQRLLAEVPHHPMVLTELALVSIDQEQYGAVEKLAKAERAHANDSLLLAHELTTALERLARPRDAAQVALDAWVASPYEAEWATVALGRLVLVDAKGVRERVRKVAEKMPDRVDLQRGWAKVEWRAGETASALRVLEQADRPGQRPSLRWQFADEVLPGATTRDTLAALEALVSLAADARQPEIDRLQGARRAWNLAVRRADEAEIAPRLAQGLGDVPPARWDPDLVVGLARGLRESGRTTEARALLDVHEGAPTMRHTVSLERALADLRDGPAERALPALEKAAATSPEARYRLAEAYFFAGLPDSALAAYQKVAENPQSPFAGPALERIFLIEDARPKDALPAFGRIAYEEWRGNRAVAAAAAESLYLALPRGPLWAHAALLLSARRESAGNLQGALEPALAVAEHLPDDRLAPVGRQRAGDLYVKLGDVAAAATQYEECLARYPRAWNAADVRRKLEQLRRSRGS
jgi:tetratricopeptide (TPR) repeat protein